MLKRVGAVLMSIFLASGVIVLRAGDNDRTAIENGTTDKQKLLRLVNEVRARGCNCGSKYYEPAQPVAWNDKLETAAIRHSGYMKSNNNLSHTGQNGTNAGQRITAAGYKWNVYGENIAVGYATEEDVIKGWINSPSHCKNLMNNKVKDMAVARNGSYWTQVLASGE